MNSGPRHRVLSALAGFVTASPRIVIASATVLALLGVWLGVTRLAIDADTNSLISASRPFMQSYRAFQEEFGDLEGVVIALDGRGKEDAADELAAELTLLTHSTNAPPLVAGVRHRVEINEQWRLAAWAASDSELAMLASAREKIAVIARGEHTADPIALQMFSLPRDATHLRAPDGSLLFIEAMPLKDFTQLDPVGPSLAAIRQAIERVAARYPTVEIGLTGKPVLQADEMATANLDMTRASLGSLAIITVLFIVVFRGLRRPLLAVVAFAIATAWTYGAAALLVGHLTVLSTVFMLVLVGAGLDYGVHVVARFGEFRRSLDRREAARAALVSVAPGTLTGALGSAVVFLLALTTDFGGLRELGIIAGTGLLLCALAMLTVLPALLACFDRATTAVSVQASAPITPPRRLTSIAALLPVIACVAAAPWAFGFQSNLLDLQSQQLSSVQWERRIFADSASASWFAVSIARTPREVEALELAALEHPEILRTQSLHALMRPDTPARAALRAQLATCAMPWPSDIAQLPQTLAARALLEGAALPLREALPAALRDRLVSPHGALLVQYFPRDDAWDEPSLERFVSAVRSIDAHATGVPMTQLESIRDMRNAFVRVSWLSILAVTIIAWLDFRRIALSLLATATVLAGVAMLFGLMPLVGIQLNLANFFAIPMLIGLGIDSAIHILHRWREAPDQLASTVRAVAFTALTTAIGFGALMFAQHRGMRSLGIAMGVGSLTCMYVACVVLPLMLRSIRRNDTQTNSGSTPGGSA